MSTSVCGPKRLMGVPWKSGALAPRYAFQNGGALAPVGVRTRLRQRPQALKGGQRFRLDAALKGRSSTVCHGCSQSGY